MYPERRRRPGNAYGLPLWLVVTLIFLIGCTMGIGKAGVYKHIPTYFPHHVGSVGGLVGMLAAGAASSCPYVRLHPAVHRTDFHPLRGADHPDRPYADLDASLISRMKREKPHQDLVDVPDADPRPN